MAWIAGYAQRTVLNHYLITMCEITPAAPCPAIGTTGNEVSATLIACKRTLTTTFAIKRVIRHLVTTIMENVVAKQRVRIPWIIMAFETLNV